MFKILYLLKYFICLRNLNCSTLKSFGKLNSPYEHRDLYLCLFFPIEIAFSRALASTHLLPIRVSLICITNWWYPCTYFNALSIRVRWQAEWEQPLSFRGLHLSEISYRQQAEVYCSIAHRRHLPRGLQQKEVQEKGQQDLEEQQVIETVWIMAPVQGGIKTALVMPKGHRGHTDSRCCAIKHPHNTARENTQLRFN